MKWYTGKCAAREKYSRIDENSATKSRDRQESPEYGREKINRALPSMNLDILLYYSIRLLYVDDTFCLQVDLQLHSNQINRAFST